MDARILKYQKLTHVIRIRLRRFLANHFGKRVLLVDPQTFEWGGITVKAFERECHRHMMNVTIFDLDLNNINIEPTDPVAAIHSRQECAAGRFPPLYQLALYPTCMELQIGRWEFDCHNSEHWESLMKYVARATSTYTAMNRSIDRQRPDIIVYFQGYLELPAVARLIATRRHIALFSFERTFSGCHLVWDSVSGISVNLTLAPNYFWRYMNTLAPAEVDRWFERFRTTYRQSKNEDHISPMRPYSSDTTRRKLLFLSQVYTDSSTFAGLPKIFYSQSAVIERLKAICASMNLYFLIKLHPKENGGNAPSGQPLNNLTWRRIRSTFANNPHTEDWLIDTDNRYDTMSLVEAADVVVTINSQSGLEAAMHRKNVITCGHSFYSEGGFTQRAHDWEDLALKIREGLQGPLSEQAFRRLRDFLFIYFQYYCVRRNPTAFVDKLAKAPYLI